MKKAKQTKTYIGGQAVIEGVMMKSPWRTALAVRTGEGEISVEDVEYTSAGDRHRWMKKPFIRGVVNLVEMMVLGTKLITRSAELAFPEDAENAPPKAQKTVGTGQLEQKGDAKESEGECAADETSTALDAGTIGSSRMLLLQSREEAERPGQNKSADMPKEEKSSMQVAATIGAVLGIGLALCLFVVLPSLIVSWIAPAGSNMNPTVLNIIEGGVRLGIFLAYLLLVTLMPDIRRVFMYHGAEHKVVFCHERNLPLDVENARTCPRLHPRCGTSFLLLVMIISILVFSLTGWSGAWYLRIGLRLLLFPVVAAISYELLRLAAGSEAAIVRALRFPGVQLQRLTTREPSDDMLEVALAAFLRAAQPIEPLEKDKAA